MCYPSRFGAWRQREEIVSFQEIGESTLSLSKGAVSHSPAVLRQAQDGRLP
jgi:hypothetical protein